MIVDTYLQQCENIVCARFEHDLILIDERVNKKSTIRHLQLVGSFVRQSHSESCVARERSQNSADEARDLTARSALSQRATFQTQLIRNSTASAGLCQRELTCYPEYGWNSEADGLQLEPIGFLFYLLS